jgi:cation transport regulator ChaC
VKNNDEIRKLRQEKKASIIKRAVEKSGINIEKLAKNSPVKERKSTSKVRI